MYCQILIVEIAVVLMRLKKLLNLFRAFLSTAPLPAIWSKLTVERHVDGDEVLIERLLSWTWM